MSENKLAVNRGLDRRRIFKRSCTAVLVEWRRLGA